MTSIATPGAGMSAERRGALVDLAIWAVAFGGVAAIASALNDLVAKAAPLGWLFPIVPMVLLFMLSSWLLHRRGDSWRSVGFRAPVSIRRVAGLVVAGYIGAVLMNAVVVIILTPKLGVARPAFGPFLAVKGHPVIFAYWLVFAWVSAALGEEFQFRGFLWSRLERLFGHGRGATALTLVIQAIGFGACHAYQGLSGMLATGAAGLSLGAVYWAGRRNLVADMVLHGLIDTVSLTVLFLGIAPPAVTG